MRKVASPELDLEVTVDEDVEAIDWDQTLAKFLLNYVRTQPSTSAGTSATEPSINISEDERQVQHGSPV